MGAEVLKKFGRYFLLDHIAQGGMAEINRARLASPEGAGRILVIKRIQAGFGGQSEFYQMFKSEIKVTMGFNHPNIVQLYDFGEEENQPYIAMELVDGKNLRQFLARFAELKQSFPVEFAVSIIEQAAAGLHYAHSFRDKVTGVSLNIVHRDISPQNILVSYDGTVKVIDFGIAKAASNQESTRAGVIKGKPSYLSPEQISGDTLDGRSDIFALGIVLWELLTGRKLFAGENDLAILKLIEACATHVKPPSTLNPKVPKELDYIVLKCLAKQRESRYQTGEEMQRALHKFLYSSFPDFNPGDLSYQVKELFKAEIVEDRKNLQRLSERADELLSIMVTDGGRGGSGSSSSGDRPPDPSEENTYPGGRKPTGITRVLDIGKPGKNEKVEIDMARAPQGLNVGGVTGAGGQPRPNPQAVPMPNQSRGTGSGVARPMPSGARTSQTGQTQAGGGGDSGLMKPLLIGAVGLVAVAFLGPEYGIRIPYLSDMLSSSVGTSGEAQLTLEGQATDVVVMLNGQTVSQKLPYTVSGVPVGTSFTVQVVGSQGRFAQEFTLKKGERKSVPVVFADRPINPNENGMNTGVKTSVAGAPQIIAGTDPSRAVVLKLNVVPGGGGFTVTLNGQSLDPDNLSVQVPLDSPLELVVNRNGFKPYRREFVIDSKQLNGAREWPVDVAMEPTRFGFLTIRTTPMADAIILIEGKPWVRKTPLENEKLPVGTYQIRLVNEALGMEKSISVTISDGRVANIEERLGIR
ncbi:MAG: serine/threonine protein kinase [Bdellovibrionales bacterium]|nr:serine/threonine protein kinase [Bdellovibrionales bacterium]